MCLWVEKRAVVIKVTKEKKNVLPRATLIEIMEWKTENKQRRAHTHTLRTKRFFTHIQHGEKLCQTPIFSLWNTNVRNASPSTTGVCICLCEMDQKSIRILGNDRIKSKIFILLRRRHRCCWCAVVLFCSVVCMHTTGQSKEWKLKRLHPPASKQRIVILLQTFTVPFLRGDPDEACLFVNIAHSFTNINIDQYSRYIKNYGEMLVLRIYVQINFHRCNKLNRGAQCTQSAIIVYRWMMEKVSHKEYNTHTHFFFVSWPHTVPHVCVTYCWL